MTVPVLPAAKRPAERSGRTLSNPELQKPLYPAHMVHPGGTDGEPEGIYLAAGNFQAWDHGPVPPDPIMTRKCSERTRIFLNPVSNIFHGQADPPAGPERAIPDEAYDGPVSRQGGAGSARLAAAARRSGGAAAGNGIETT